MNGAKADVIIVGGGAAGLTAAIFAAQAGGPSLRVLVLDAAKTLGAKILVSGGGRCNVTHDHVSPEDYNGPRTLVRNILAAFDEQATARWFSSMGVELKREETGKLFPVTDSARAVLQALLRTATEAGIVFEPSRRVSQVDPPTADVPHFGVRCGDETFIAPRIILAAGGRSLPRSGSDGSGWELARKLGHSVTSTFAALVPLVLAPEMFHALLAGISMNVELSTWVEGKLVDRRAGSLLWTHFGISGPVVMDASRHWVGAIEAGKAAEIRCNLVCPSTFDAIEAKLVEAGGSRPRGAVLKLLGEWIPERVAAAVLNSCQIDAAQPIGQLTRDARRSLAHALTALPLQVRQHRGWNYAEVTAGGVPLAEINFRTMESRKVPSLYFAGEILDCDGRIGGFNFQWAWATGYLAGRAAARDAASRA